MRHYSCILVRRWGIRFQDEMDVGTPTVFVIGERQETRYATEIAENYKFHLNLGNNWNDVWIKVQQMEANRFGVILEKKDAEPIYFDYSSISKTPDGKTLRDVEKQAIIDALQANRGNRAGAAKTLGIGERSIYRKLREYDLN